jgi:hypothetical protein
MCNLDNPRGLAFGPEGGLYVAEAGRVWYGPTGAVSRFWQGRQERVATGLPSYASRIRRAEGPNDIAMLGVGSALLVIGLEASPLTPDDLSTEQPEWAGFGRLVHVPASGDWRFVAEIAADEKAINPAGGIIDSNPFGLLAGPGRHLVVDAGSNAVLTVDANGDISTPANLRIHDADHRPVNARGDGIWSIGESGFCNADSSGTCTLATVLPTSVANVTISVQRVSLGAATYDPTRNHDVGGETNGTSIVVKRR